MGERSLVSVVDDDESVRESLPDLLRQVGFEAGTLTQYLSYGLSEAGYEVVCMEARQVAASHPSRGAH